MSKFNFYFLCFDFPLKPKKADWHIISHQSAYKILLHLLISTLLFLTEPSSEHSTFEDREYGEKDVCKKNENKGRYQNTGIFFTTDFLLTNRLPHAERIPKDSKIKKTNRERLGYKIQECIRR